jgi:hypothetical protein
LYQFQQKRANFVWGVTLEPEPPNLTLQLSTLIFTGKVGMRQVASLIPGLVSFSTYIAGFHWYIPTQHWFFLRITFYRADIYHWGYFDKKANTSERTAWYLTGVWWEKWYPQNTGKKTLNSILVLCIYSAFTVKWTNRPQVQVLCKDCAFSSLKHDLHVLG